MNVSEALGSRPSYKPKFMDKWLEAVTERCLDIMRRQQYKENAMLIKCKRVVSFDHPRIDRGFAWRELAKNGEIKFRDNLLDP